MCFLFDWLFSSEGENSAYEFSSKKDEEVFIFQFTKNGKPFTWKDFIKITKEKDRGFISKLKEAILSTELKTIFFNCPPLTSSILEEKFEMAILEAPGLDGIRTDMYTFEKNLRNKDLVASFENLGGDALMVCPVPLEGQNKQIYSSLGPFIHGAPMEQQIAFWGDVGSGLSELVNNRTCWLNTEGSGVHFLHMRIDSRPKYYHYLEFSNESYYEK